MGWKRPKACVPLLRQLWRVLAPEGRILLVAPNRASLWAQVERSPFGQGRPFSKTELDGLLKGALFAPCRWERALYAPPLQSVTAQRRGLGENRWAAVPRHRRGASGGGDQVALRRRHARAAKGGEGRAESRLRF